MQEQTIKNLNSKFGMGILHSLFFLFVIGSSIWFCLAIWFQEPINSFIAKTIIVAWFIFAIFVLLNYSNKKIISRSKSTFLYVVGFALSLIWYFSIAPLQNREWDPEVAQVLNFEKNGSLVTLHNVRDFNWRTEKDYDVHWISRTVDLNKIKGVNVITSYWMGPQIAHTLVSFDFENSEPLTFSIEIRKEKNESFSAIGGFFRKFELSLIASNETDIVYTRSNIRKEQVYFFPIKMPKVEMQALFEQYLDKTVDLEKNPKWYNTLTSNCTTLVFDMAQAVSKHQLPLDYRLLASGYLPNYLHDLHSIDPKWTMKEWYAHAHVNPKTKHLTATNINQYSELIRKGLNPSQN
jgi:hypothetical protein